MTRQFTWLSLLDQAELSASKSLQIEYEFTARGSGGLNNDRTHEAGLRVFRGNPATRGGYADAVASDNGLTWNGTPITWGDDELTWGDA